LLLAAGFVSGRPHVADAMTELDQVRLFEEAQRMRGFNGAYQLVNGPINPALGARYQPNRVHPAWKGRVGDGDIRRFLKPIAISTSASGRART
jgi:hypothetical protein